MPEHPGIKKLDFFEYEGNADITIGNPPFGKRSQLAIDFFNHAARFSKHIAFILPRTFEKNSVQNKLNLNFHLVSSKILPVKSFELDGKPYAVPCVFQIWERRNAPRSRVEQKRTHKDFVFVKDPADSFFALQRIGFYAGKIKTPTGRSKESHLFIRAASGQEKDNAKVLSIFEQMSFESVRYSTAGPRSISKAEIIDLYDSLTKN